jgi:glyoxylase-like metal-dependent hydrolase (beta-lactamase superfamily II)
MVRVFLRQFKAAAGANMSYIVAEGPGGPAAVIDPTGELSRITGVIEAEGLRVLYILTTHSHPDHTSGNGKLAAETGAKIAAHRLASMKKDITLEDGAVLRVGALEVRALHTPGHSRDGMCYLVGDKLFTGDTLFVGECGRTDMPGGDAGALYDSLFNRLLKLPDQTEVFPGHDYGPRPTSTIGRERKTNYVLEPRTREEFIEFMAEP